MTSRPNTPEELAAAQAAFAIQAAPTTDSVNAERDRRIRIGKTFTIPGYGNIPVEGREEDFRNLGNLGTAALAQVGAGQGAATMQFRDAANVIHTLTWAQMLVLWQLATGYVSAIYAASWALKDNPPIPGDFTEAGYWP